LIANLHGTDLLSRDLLFLLIGAVLGGLINLLIVRASIWLTRQHTKKALIQDIRFCCALAEGIGGYLKDHTIPLWEKGDVCVSYPELISTKFWEVAMEHLEFLPGKDLGRLLSFYHFAEHINYGTAIMQNDQQSFMQSFLTQQPLRPDHQQALKDSTIDKARLIARQCQKLAGYKNISHLDDQPADMFAEG